MYNFEKLKAWQQAMELVDITYKATKKIPASEKFALIDQIKRSATSVALNIAEGTGARSNREFSNFCRISLRSLYETITALKIAERVYKIDVTVETKKCDEVSKILHGLLKYLDHKN